MSPMSLIRNIEAEMAKNACAGVVMIIPQEGDDRVPKILLRNEFNNPFVDYLHRVIQMTTRGEWEMVSQELQLRQIRNAKKMEEIDREFHGLRREADRRDRRREKTQRLLDGIREHLLAQANARPARQTGQGGTQPTRTPATGAPAQPAQTPTQPAQTPTQPAQPAQTPAQPAQPGVGQPGQPARAPAPGTSTPTQPAQQPGQPAQQPGQPAQPDQQPRQYVEPSTWRDVENTVMTARSPEEAERIGREMWFRTRPPIRQDDDVLEYAGT
jgi:hypothetical protein